MVLDTVQAYVTAARRLLQDTVEPFRYADDVYLEGVNFGILEARRIRPDLFIGVDAIPSFDTVDTTTVDFEPQFRLSLLYYSIAHVLMQDDEETEDQRSMLFLQKFNNTLLSSGT